MTDKDNVLNFLLGDKTCVDGTKVKIMNFIFLPLSATIIFFLFCMDCFGVFSCLGNRTYQFAAKGILFFIIMYLLQRIVNRWKEARVICKK